MWNSWIEDKLIRGTQCHGQTQSRKTKIGKYVIGHIASYVNTGLRHTKVIIIGVAGQIDIDSHAHRQMQLGTLLGESSRDR